MKYLFILIALCLIVLTIFAACGSSQPESEELEYILPSSGQIHLFGEIHSHPPHVEMQFEFWHYFYTQHGMRHLFVEMPFFTAEFLNLWMLEDDNEILNELFSDSRGTAFDSDVNREFLLRIKAELPETVFHGTDVGHKYNTTGQRFLQHLRDTGQEGTEIYYLTQENMQQGRDFYGPLKTNDSLRADMMVENFIRAFDTLQGESIMSAFYGAAHVMLGYYNERLGGGPTMASRILERYGTQVHLTDLRELEFQWLLENTDTTEKIIGDTVFEAIFVGKSYIYQWLPWYLKREFYLIKNAYEYFSSHPQTGKVLPFDDYPFPVEIGQVFAIRYTFVNGNIRMEYYRASGRIRQGQDITEEFRV